MAVISEVFDNLGLEDPSKTYRLGIMGGTFDPIHIGHLACAEQVRNLLSLDGVLFIPAGSPVFKQDKQVSAAHHRLEMCRLAVQSNSAFDVSSLEIDRSGLTYTVDTLRQLREHFPENVELFFITGADAMFNIISWRDSGSIAQLAHLVAATRPGYVLSDERKEYLAQHSDFSITYAEVTALAISSSDLRAMVAQDRSIRYLTMQNVHDYISEHGLYAEESQESQESHGR